MKLIVISISSGIIIHLISFKSFTFFNQGLLNNSAIILVGLVCYVSVFLFIGVITKTFNKNSTPFFLRSPPSWASQLVSELTIDAKCP